MFVFSSCFGIFIRGFLHSHHSHAEHWPCFRVLEEALELHSLNPILAPTYNPTLLARNPALSSDIAHLLSTSESSWQQHPVALSVFHNLPKPLTDYTARIHAISKSTTPSLLLAHAYVRYLGDLSGGQVIRHNIVKAYNLDTAPGLGTQFYAFKKLGGGGTATQGDMKKIKEWYREGMNTGVGGEENLKGSSNINLPCLINLINF